MALPFVKSASQKRDGLIAIDLGGKTTKAIEVRKSGDRFVLKSFALMDAPTAENGNTVEVLSDHLKTLCHALAPKTRSTALALNVNDAIVRYAEMPQIPIGDMRQLLKNNSKQFLQQDLPDHVFDCFITAGRFVSKPADKPAVPVSPKMRVLVAGAPGKRIEDSHQALKSAGLTPDSVVPGLIGPLNAFEMALPEVFAKESVALVDIGFHSTSICLLQEGELVLSRVVAIGGDKLTSGLAEAMGISYAEAEGIKIGIPAEVQNCLEPLITPLARELRASIDCFEHQQDRTITQVFLSGASARSEFITQALQAELMLECKPWNPISFMDLALSPEQAAGIDQVAQQLTVAVGAALAAY